MFWKATALTLLALLALLCAYDYLVTRASARATLQWLNEPIVVQGGQPIPRVEVLRQLLDERVQQQPAHVSPTPSAKR